VGVAVLGWIIQPTWVKKLVLSALKHLHLIRLIAQNPLVVSDFKDIPLEIEVIQ